MGKATDLGSKLDAERREKASDIIPKTWYDDENNIKNILYFL